MAAPERIEADLAAEAVPTLRSKFLAGTEFAIRTAVTRRGWQLRDTDLKSAGGGELWYEIFRVVHKKSSAPPTISRSCPFLSGADLVVRPAVGAVIPQAGTDVLDDRLFWRPRRSALRVRRDLTGMTSGSYHSGAAAPIQD
jgi:hypothetical protein